MPDLNEIFSEDGVLARSISGFRRRTQQLEMAEAVALAISNNSVLVAEAGTGTGKTFAYLAPALLSGGKVIVSTGTKTLQDQLFTRDVPALRDALKVPITIALLKGRSNYVCHYHLERAVNDGRFLNREDAQHVHQIKRYAKTSTSGDKSGLSEVPENSPVWMQVTSTRDNCLGQECTFHGDCFVMEARKQAQQADVVIVNHHLFFADVMLRDEGMAELLPACNTVIFDEAHQLPEIASLFFGESVGAGQLFELARDAHSEAFTAARDFAALPEATAALEKAIRDLRLTIPDDNARLPMQNIRGLKGFSDALALVSSKLDELNKMLESQAERSEGLESCWRRGQELAAKINRWRDSESLESVRWLEVFNHGLQLNSTPLSIAEIFQKRLTATARSWIFTSATLSVNRNFSHYCSEMGLAETATACWESPFDFQNQALLYVPQGMPEPNSRDYTEAVVKAALPIVEACGGRAFLLFTSLRAMRIAHELVTQAFEQRGLEYPLLMQGEGSRTELLERFRQLGNAVLLGSQSFWEGVDVRGEALSLVVIDKLPFAPPDDPVLAARIEQITKQGRNAFMEYQLPHAVINLKQGAGRLIRGEMDRGVLMICDPRLITKPYGRKIWQSLPPMKRTRESGEVEAFFERLEAPVSA